VSDSPARLILKQQWTIKISAPFFYFLLGGHLGWKSGSLDTILERPFHHSLVAIGKMAAVAKSQNELKF
jgi:hypothetical protein